jgi:diguanylate cyclase (GGDEF)-like protein
MNGSIRAPRTGLLTGAAVLAAAGLVAVVGVVNAVREPAPPILVGPAIGLLFLAILARLVVLAVLRPGQRASLSVLAAGIVLFTAASAFVQTREPQTISAVELLFLAFYVCVTAFLLLDVRRTGPRSAAVWLEAVLLASSTASAASFLLLAALGGDQPGPAQVLALVYPAFDVLLAALVVAQMGLRNRPFGVRGLLLVVALLMFAASDSAFSATLSQGRYLSSALMSIGWAGGLALLALGAGMPRGTVRVDGSGSTPAALLVAAAAVAVLVLASPDAAVHHWSVEIPALLALAAASARLILSLREAQALTTAYRGSLRDGLTGLPNRRGLVDALDGAAPAQGMVLLDLEAFQDINDSFGHANGDLVLRTVADRLRERLPAGDLVARVGGDAFAIAAAAGSDAALATRSGLVREMLAEPIRVDGLDVVLRSVTGAAARRPGEPGDELLRRAHVALYRAKRSGSDALIYDPDDDERSRDHLRHAEALRRAISAGEIVAWYQPQVDASTWEVVGVEALVRWDDPEQGVRPPGSFLPTARRAGLMPALTDTVLRQAVADARGWAAAGRSWRVAVNIAPPELLGGAVVPAAIALVDDGAAGLPLVVEVTEDSFLADPERARQAVAALDAHGIEVSVDDYGTGFSSLAYLRDLEVGELKIDRTFVAAMEVDDRRARLIVSSTVQMAHALGLRVVAEGVETAAVAADLVAEGVDVVQGYHVAPPMPRSVLEAWVRDWEATHPAAEPSRQPRSR